MRMIEINETEGEVSPVVTKIASFIETSVQNYEVTFSSDSEPDYFECRLDLDGLEGPGKHASHRKISTILPRVCINLPFALTLIHSWNPFL